MKPISDALAKSQTPELLVSFAGYGGWIQSSRDVPENVPHHRFGNGRRVMQFTKQRLASVENAPGLCPQSVNGVPVAKIIVIAVGLFQCKRRIARHHAVARQGLSLDAIPVGGGGMGFK